MTSLNLRTNNLVGVIPTSLGNLTELRNLNLESNLDLRGPIPSSLGNLRELRTLFLHWNSLTGSIPPTLNNLTKLGTNTVYTQPVFMEFNLLTGVIPQALCKFRVFISRQRNGVNLPCAQSAHVGAFEVRLVPGDGRIVVVLAAAPRWCCGGRRL